MRYCKLLAIGVASLAVVAAIAGIAMWQTRSVRAENQAADVAPGTFNPEESVGFFVGVSELTVPGVGNVPFAADDAVDLAHFLALDQRVSLLLPSRVVIALSGLPKKEESRARLLELRQAGATIVSADAATIRTELQRQATLAGKHGLFLVSLATHGFLQDDIHYILGRTSAFDADTALAVPDIFRIIDRSKAQRSLIFVDACRNFLPPGARGAQNNIPALQEKVRKRMEKLQGQIVFYATPHGGYAWDDFKSQNGVFTGAVLRGLDCGAAQDRGIVTMDSLKKYVEREARRWVQKEQRLLTEAATQVVIEGSTENIPLTVCVPPKMPAPAVQPFTAELEGDTARIFDEQHQLLWSKTIGTKIAQAEVRDLDEDGANEVLLAVTTPTGDQLLVLDHLGQRDWSQSIAGMSLRNIVVDDFLNGEHGSQIAALWAGDRKSRVVLYAGDGRADRNREFPHRVLALGSDRPTARHVPRIVVAVDEHKKGTMVMMFEASKLTRKKPKWQQLVRPRGAIVKSLRFTDFNKDRITDLQVVTNVGSFYYSLLEGHDLGSDDKH